MLRARGRDRVGELLRSFDPGYDHPIGPDVKGPLDVPGVQLRNADKGDRVAADGSPDVVDHISPIEVPMLGVDDYEVESQSHCNLRDTGRIEGDPQSMGDLVGGQSAAKLSQSGDVHVEWNGVETGWRHHDPCLVKANF